MPRDASELARCLASHGEAVCRHYLSNGRRQGRYWTVGDVCNTPDRSMFVRLSGPESGPGAAGHWTDAASAEYGNLLDVIRESCGLVDFRDVADEARRFLSLPRAEPRGTPKPVRTPVPAGSSEAARRLFAISQPIHRTLVETYLHNRGIRNLRDAGGLRFHPRCHYRPEGDGPTETWPAMVAAVTELQGRIIGAHRTWLARDGSGKAPIETQRKAMGELLGHAVRFGAADDVLAVGEGIETMLSLRCALPAMPMAAALSANHLAALLLPLTLRRLYIARDADAAGDTALAVLTERAEAAGIDALALFTRWATLTRTCVHSASAGSGGHCASSSHRRMSFASCAGERPGRVDGFGFSPGRSGEAHAGQSRAAFKRRLLRRVHHSEQELSAEDAATYS